MDVHLVAFLGIAVLVIVTPGPDTALTIRNTLSGGRRGGLGTALGVATGQAVWTVATSAGVAALLVASASAFAALRLAGAGYLVWLGAQALWASARVGVEAEREAGRGALTAARADGSVRAGYPQQPREPEDGGVLHEPAASVRTERKAAFSDLLALGLLFCAMTLGWLAAYAAVVARAGDILRRLGVRRAIEAVTGLALLALGARLALERR